MSVFARSDAVSVHVPVESGGCGESHVRPVIDGAPVRIWKLTCSACEKYIREDIARSTYTTIIDGKKHVVNNGLWSDSQIHIPLTPDESEMADAMEKSGQTIMHQVAEGMSRQAIENLQKQQASEIQQQEDARHAATAAGRVAQLEAQLAEMRQVMESMYGRMAASAPVSVSVATETPDTPSEAPKATQRQVHASASNTHCASCGGPLRRPGDRGPTLKGTCRDCRTAARVAKGHAA